MIELKPCPFCGSSRVSLYQIRESWHAECRNCGASSSSFADHRDYAAEAWNRRAEDPALERLKQAAVEWTANSTQRTGHELQGAAEDYGASVKRAQPAGDSR